MDLFSSMPTVAAKPFRSPVLYDMGGVIAFDDKRFQMKEIKGFGPCRILKPTAYFHCKPEMIQARYANDLVLELADCEPGFIADVILSGAFYFSDFIKMYIQENNFHVSRLHIATLSLNVECVDIFKELIKDGWVDELNLVVSAIFFRDFPETMAYIYEHLGSDDRVNIAVASSHMKDVLIRVKSDDPDYSDWCITMSGSANSRSSQCLEHLVIREGEEVYNWNAGVLDKIMDEFSIINKDVEYVADLKAARNIPLWETITGKPVESEKIRMNDTEIAILDKKMSAYLKAAMANGAYDESIFMAIMEQKVRLMNRTKALSEKLAKQNAKL